MNPVRRLSAAAAVALLGATALLGAPADPAGAAPTDSDALVFVPFGDAQTAVVRNGQVTTASFVTVRDAVVAGDFSAAPGTDVFVYSYGSAPDGIIHVTPTGTGATTSFRPEVVNAYYEPRAGDFDANGIDDILWYGGGKAQPDSIWLFQPDGSHTIVTLSVTGYYFPVVGDFDGNGHDDVIWQGYLGDRADSMWMFGEGATYTKRSITINGRYQALVGSYGPVGTERDQVAWYSYDGGPSSIWTFTAHGKTSRPLPAVPDAHPVVGDFIGTGNDAIFWYRPGSPSEAMTTFDAGGGPTFSGSVPQVNGTYFPVAGDFDGDLEDGIAWTREGRATIWRFTGAQATGYTQTIVDTGQRETVPVVAHPTTIED